MKLMPLSSDMRKQVYTWRYNIQLRRLNLVNIRLSIATIVVMDILVILSLFVWFNNIVGFKFSSPDW